MNILRSLTLLIAIFASLSALAKDDKNDAQISDLNWVSNTFLSSQRSTVEELSRRYFGAKIRGDKSDLFTLQRLIDKQVIKRDDSATLQALGVVLGDVYISENKNLHWQLLEDELGSSHVVCIKNTQHCLFPVTMLSRRIEVGLNPKVEKVYNDGLESIQDYLPKLPFND